MGGRLFALVIFPSLVSFFSCTHSLCPSCKCFIYTNCRVETIDSFFFCNCINSCVLFSFVFVCSPVFPTRSAYTPTSNLHYFTNSPTPESQMWSTASANSEDFDRPKGGALPEFQRLAKSYYQTNGHAAHINYSSQVVSIFILIRYCWVCANLPQTETLEFWALIVVKTFFRIFPPKQNDSWANHYDTSPVAYTGSPTSNTTGVRSGRSHISAAASLTASKCQIFICK